jgi:undecaprenyl diphosphate synthase
MGSKVTSVPRHVGYILDGNRRWAKKYGLPTYEGHLAGYNSLKDVIEATADAGVEYISFYTFSTQNWNRAEGEVYGIMRLIRRLFKTDITQLVKEGYKLVVLGSRENLPVDIVKLMDEAQIKSKNGTKATLAMCFNYGGQEEIIRAAQRLIDANASKVDRDSFINALDHPEVPDCDLIVRTSGEQRLSDFMLWRSAYSEFIFLNKFWPEMTKDDVVGILEEYKRRSRRFGG